MTSSSNGHKLQVRKLRKTFGEFVALEGADHLLSDPAQAREAGELMATWAAQSLELADR